MDEWEEKQADFLRFLQEHGAEQAPYRVDLEKRKIYWVDEHDLSLVVADCRVLLSYALSNNAYRNMLQHHCDQCIIIR